MTRDEIKRVKLYGTRLKLGWSLNRMVVHKDSDNEIVHDDPENHEYRLQIWDDQLRYRKTGVMLCHTCL